MRYMLLIYNPIDSIPELPPSDKWLDYTKELIAAGVLLAGDPLQGIETATTVRVRNDKVLMTDGPYAETKEHLLGYYIIDCDLDTALDWAAKIPSAPWGAVEVRPLQDFPMPA
jgi:hypothetical protein